MEKKEILSAIYEQFTQESPPTDSYMELENKFVEKREEFLKKVGEEKREEFERITDIIYSMGRDMNKQCFIEGYVLCTKLLFEAITND